MAEHPLHRQSLYPAYLALVSTLLLGGCTVRHTPSEPTPVYSEGLPPGAAPLAVERISINTPEVRGTNEPEAPPQSEQTRQPGAPSPGQPATDDGNMEDAAAPDTDAAAVSPIKK